MEAKRKILVAEDERPLRRTIVSSLTSAGYEVHGVADGEQAIQFLDESDVDIVILDVMMPKLDGFQVCQWLRTHSELPVVLLTSLDATEDIVKGFECGADDYITKPFTFDELRARIEAILRRVRSIEKPRLPVVSIGQMHIDTITRMVTRDGIEIHLTPMEFELLYFLMTHSGQAVSKELLFRRVWGYDFVGGTNLVEVAVRRLREKIEPTPSHPTYIQTVRGIGYRFIETVS